MGSCGIGAAVLAAALVVGCSAGDEQGRGAAGSGGTAGSAGSGGGAAAGGMAGSGGNTGFSGSGGSSGSGGDSGASGAGGVRGGVGDETLCNGLDDDADGVIDDVDVGMDGVCDCLTVATLGTPGGAQGNVFNAWLDARSTMGAVDLGSMGLSAAVLEPFQVLVVQNVEGRVFAAPEIEAVRAWVEAGGGLMTLIGYSGPTEAASVNTLLAPFGVSYGNVDVMVGGCPPNMLPILCTRESKPVTEWQTHPIATDVTQVGMDNGKPVMGSGTVVATGEGHDLAMAVESGAGKVFVWGDEWVTFDSDWNGRPEFQVERFWTNAFKWLTPETLCQVPPPPPPD